MRPTLVRFTVRRLMVTVAAIALMFAASRLLAELRYRTFYGWNTSVLSTGALVSIWENAESSGVPLPAGTMCVVVSDFVDEDSAYPGRSVGIRISSGPHSGRIVYVPRNGLRVR